MITVTTDATPFDSKDVLNIYLEPDIARRLADQLYISADRFEKEEGKEAKFTIAYMCTFVDCKQGK